MWKISCLPYTPQLNLHPRYVPLTEIRIVHTDYKIMSKGMLMQKCDLLDDLCQFRHQKMQVSVADSTLSHCLTTWHTVRALLHVFILSKSACCYRKKATCLFCSPGRTDLFYGMKRAWIKPVQVFSVRDTFLELSSYLCLVYFLQLL